MSTCPSGQVFCKSTCLEAIFTHHGRAEERVSRYSLLLFFKVSNTLQLESPISISENDSRWFRFWTCCKLYKQYAFPGVFRSYHKGPYRLDNLFINWLCAGYGRVVILTSNGSDSQQPDIFTTDFSNKYRFHRRYLIAILVCVNTNKIQLINTTNRLM